MTNPNLRPRGILILVAVLAAASVALVMYVRGHSALAMARKMKNPVPATPAALVAGRQLYAEHCQKCHGEKGNGQGAKAAELTIAPSDFTNASEMGDLPDGQLFLEITKGELPMPAFEDKLSEQERWQLVDYIRTFSPTRAPGH
jgi:mono/diheme cytochrome c family protein